MSERHGQSDAPDRLVALFDTLCEDALDERQLAELDALLADNSIREEYIRLVHLQSDLTRTMRGGAPADLSDGSTEASTAPVAGRIGSLKALAVAAALLLAAIGIYTAQGLFGGATPTDDAPSGPIATVVETNEVEWRSAPVFAGTDVPPRVLEIAAGSVDLLIGGAVEARLYGPATLELVSTDRCVLGGGRVDVIGVEGFTVAAPGFVVIDRGTQFSVAASADGTGDVLVHEGEVEVILGDRPAHRLVAGQAVAVRGGSLHDRLPSETELSRTPAAPSVLADWTFDDLPIGAALIESQVLLDAAHRGRGARLAPGAAVEVVPGAESFGGRAALRLDAQSAFPAFSPTIAPEIDDDLAPPAELRFGPRDSFTIEAIFRTTQADMGALVANDWGGRKPSWWLRVQDGGLRFLICDGPQESDAVTHERVNDGRWHHVAAVRDAESRKLRLYVDQRLVVESEDVTAGALANTRDIHIGRFTAGGRAFIGDIDRVRISGRALEPERFIEPTTVTRDDPAPQPR